LTILESMALAISSSNTGVAEPHHVCNLKVKPERNCIRMIGKGETTIRAITEETGCIIRD